MDRKPISPWADHAERVSPDGRYTALFTNGSEIAMGGPTIGELRTKMATGSVHLIADDAAASFVWSEAPRGKETEIKQVDARLRAFFSEHYDNSAYGST